YHYHNGQSDTIRFNGIARGSAPVVYRIFRDKAGVVWVTTSAGLYTVDGNSLVKHPVGGKSRNIDQAIFSITEDKAGALWLGANSGVIKVSGAGIQHYGKHNGLRDNSFLDMFTDATGNVWMASDGQGVFRFSGMQFTVLDEAMGLPSAQ